MTAFAASNRKIDPARRPRLKPDGTPDDNDRVEIGPTALAFDEWEAAGLTPPDLPAMREYRLARLVAELNRRDLGGLLMFDPLNIRYATDTTNMQLWITHNPCRACLVTADGHMVLWDFHSCEHLSAHLPLVREVRHGASFFYFESGDRVEEHAAHFAAEVDGLLRARAGPNRRLAIDRIESAGLDALRALGIETVQGQPVTEHARAIKGVEDIRAMRCAIHSCEQAMHEMRAVVRPGITEVEAWAEMQRGNHIRGGEWIETRILSSGPRTNPWFQECGPRVMKAGELLAFDTDMIGVYGMCCDISRTWLVGEGEPTAAQRDLYRVAHEHIMRNAAMVAPGVSFAELTERGHRLPPEYRAQRYGVMFHGVGLCDEYPSIRYPEDIEASGYDGVLEPGMTLCVEVYAGAVGGSEGVKLEDQLLVTETGVENMTRFPFEESWLD